MRVGVRVYGWICCAGLLSVLLLLRPAGKLKAANESDEIEETSSPKFSREAEAIFGKRCTACHTFGKGIKVGPDLKGVTDRRRRDWLVKFIHGSSAVIQSGDPIATRLFAEFKQQRMPDWIDLSDKQISDILDYLTIGGPDIKPPDERSAELATPAEIEKGRQLFFGDERFKYGAQACATCHSVQSGGLRGGTLGPDLTDVYLRHQDKALTAFLREPCFQWNGDALRGRYLTSKESFTLKAFLRQIAMRATTRAAAADTGKEGGQ